MQDKVDAVVRVYASWNEWHTAEVRLRDIEDVHWCRPPGAPGRMLHGFVSCARVVSGDIPHACDGRRDGHRLLVCILKHATAPCTYAPLAGQADARAAGATPTTGRPDAVRLGA